MEKVLEHISLLLKEVSSEKTKAVKSGDYNKAAIIRDWEKELLGLESRITSEMIAHANDML